MRRLLGAPSPLSTLIVDRGSDQTNSHNAESQRHQAARPADHKPQTNTRLAWDLFLLPQIEDSFVRLKNRRRTAAVTIDALTP